MASWKGKKLHFITGRLAERALRDSLEKHSKSSGFNFSIDVLKITVAALMTPKWVAERITVPEGTDYVVVPGYCEGDLNVIKGRAGCEVIRGPRDLRRLDIFFNQSESGHQQYGSHDIEILAEINHAPRMSVQQICTVAQKHARDGADIIDIGCNPGETWSRIGDAVRAVKDLGLRVSIDSMNQKEVKMAVNAGADVVLSVDRTNREAAPDWGVEVVAVPDDPANTDSLDATVEYLANRGVPLRIDPILSPIAFGFADSLGRYLEVRKKYIDAEIMMGIGNLTELTDSDSAGINTLLLGFCQELKIRSVLTTAVIPWAQSSVRECDIARKLVHHAVQSGTLPKHVDDRLVMLRDVDRPAYTEGFFADLAETIKDHNIRLFVDNDGLHLISRQCNLTDMDPFRLFQRYLDDHGEKMNIGHAFYIGYELCKATTALTLGKNYQQDEALDWGFLTSDEAERCRIVDRRR